MCLYRATAKKKKRSFFLVVEPQTKKRSCTKNAPAACTVIRQFSNSFSASFRSCPLNYSLYKLIHVSLMRLYTKERERGA